MQMNIHYTFYHIHSGAYLDHNEAKLYFSHTDGGGAKNHFKRTRFICES